MAELITNEFTVNLPIDEAWPIICDVERIAPCLPGAELQEIEGTTYRGVVKIKLGAITANFKGEAEFIERDDKIQQIVESEQNINAASNVPHNGRMSTTNQVATT